MLYEENILVLLTYLHQNTATLFKPRGLFQVEITCQKQAPNCTINNIKMQEALTVGGGTPPPLPHPPPPLARSARSQVIFYRPLKLNPGYATAYEALTGSSVISLITPGDLLLRNCVNEALRSGSLRLPLKSNNPVKKPSDKILSQSHGQFDPFLAAVEGRVNACMGYKDAPTIPANDRIQFAPRRKHPATRYNYITHPSCQIPSINTA